MPKNNLIALLFFVCGGLLVWLLDFVADRDEMDELQITTQITADQLHLRLQNCLTPRLTAINVLSERWNSWAALQNRWISFADVAYRVLPGVQALNLVDAGYTIRQIYPIAGNEQALGANLIEHPNPEVADQIRHAEQLGSLQRTSSLELLQSGSGIAFYKVIRSDSGETLGFVNAVFRLEELFTACFSEENLHEQYIFRISEADGNEIYKISDFENESWEYSIVSSLDVAGRPWVLELAPAPDRIAALDSFADNLRLVLGFLLVFLLALATRAALNSRDSLKVSISRYRLLVENQSDLIIKVDANGKFLYASPNFCKLVNKQEEELLGKDFMEVVTPENKLAAREGFGSLSPDKLRDIRVLRSTFNGSTRWIEWSSTVLLNSAKEVDTVIIVGRDVTDQKAMETQIAHSQKMKAVGELAGGISHDFNNLLQIILANIELLLIKPEGQDKEKRLQNIRNAVNSGIELTDRLSTLSKQDSVKIEAINLNKLLTETKALIEKSIPSSILLSTHLPEKELVVCGNWSQLERVLFNLCFNARDAIAGNGSIEFALQEVSLEPEIYNAHEHLQPGNYARISVTDDGCGMRPDVLPRIFEPFFSTKQKEKGTGLGLANSYSIISQSGGIILVDSTLGEGTRFEIYLPLKEEVGDTE